MVVAELHRDRDSTGASGRTEHHSQRLGGSMEKEVVFSDVRVVSELVVL